MKMSFYIVLVSRLLCTTASTKLSVNRLTFVHLPITDEEL